MMPTFKIYITDKTVALVEGRKFRADIDGAQFWFFAHEAHHMIGLYCISDVRSGRKVMDIPFGTLSANRGDVVAAAKAAWKKFMTGRNQADVRKVLEAAPSIKEATA